MSEYVCVVEDTLKIRNETYESPEDDRKRIRFIDANSC
jgi:hypothetical protein